jgi:hypothetical protein
MKNTQNKDLPNPEDELLPEYQFNYQKARPNRFIKQSESLITITLDPDVAEVFKTSEAVNHALRSLLSAIPQANS